MRPPLLIHGHNALLNHVQLVRKTNSSLFAQNLHDEPLAVPGESTGGPGVQPVMVDVDVEDWELAIIFLFLNFFLLLLLGCVNIIVLGLERVEEPRLLGSDRVDVRIGFELVIGKLHAMDLEVVGRAIPHLVPRPRPRVRAGSGARSCTRSRGSACLGPVVALKRPPLVVVLRVTFGLFLGVGGVVAATSNRCIGCGSLGLLERLRTTGSDPSGRRLRGRGVVKVVDGSRDEGRRDEDVPAGGISIPLRAGWLSTLRLDLALPELAIVGSMKSGSQLHRSISYAHRLDGSLHLGHLPHFTSNVVNLGEHLPPDDLVNAAVVIGRDALISGEAKLSDELLDEDWLKMEVAVLREKLEEDFVVCVGPAEAVVGVEFFDHCAEDDVVRGAGDGDHCDD
ncbi:hypothetical protein F5X68DRAFT_200429 [Plectosphaerella plurivora]|uniref:Uncharacterized protein n=1 Tax=Plectosphaerella plurivora TaxID=936078 RepID=A0A9P9AB05_9PEZI|nr:hypothetical protein F5X68DRAFT_200429 [Plectosphaerella plurivora]